MIEVCFVDDDKLLLAGVKRTLRRASSSMNLTVANSGAEAIAVLTAQPVDVLISDLHMPSMDGQTLMSTVQSQFPGVARVIATGDFDPSRAFDLALVAHRIVSKPVDTNTLIALVHNLHELTVPIGDTRDQRAQEQMPWALLAAWQLSRQRTAAITAQVARANPWLAMLLLQVVNGGFVQSREVRDVHTAVRVLGPAQLSIIHARLMALAAETREPYAFSNRPRFSSGLCELLQLANEIDASTLSHHTDQEPDEHAVAASLTAPELAAVVESAILLLAVCMSEHRLNDSFLPPADIRSFHHVVLRETAHAQRSGVPVSVTKAVRQSVQDDQVVGSGTVSAILRLALARYARKYCVTDSR